MKRAILLTILVIFVFAAIFYVRLGGYKSVSMQAQEMGPYHFLFRKHTGAYYKITGDIETVERWVKSQGESCNPSFGEYLDNPNEISEDRLQSRGGCIVSDKFMVTSGKALPAETLERSQPRRLYLVATFDGAPSLGPLKVYDKAGDWIASNHYESDGPVIELYTVRSAMDVHTDYLFPIKPISQTK